MRWFWIDRFVEFERGKRAVTYKNVTLAEPALDGYYPIYAHYPHALIVEGMAQTGGLLVSEMSGFTKRVVLAKVGKATFHRFVEAGDQLRLEVDLQDVQGSGAVAHGKSYVGDELQGEIELWFAFLDSRFGDKPHFPPEYLLRWLRSMKLYDVAVDENGVRLQPPQHLLDAEAFVAQQCEKKE